jgi:hypothetical protein
MTKEEIKAEAIRRGYEGATVNSLGGNPNMLVGPAHEWFFYRDDDLLRSCGNCLIYSKGSWAPIITPSNQTEKQLPIFN